MASVPTERAPKPAWQLPTARPSTPRDSFYKWSCYYWAVAFRVKGEQRVTYVIAEPCVDVLDRACVDECPVDCIYEGKRMLYIHPDECVDCGACEPVCPVEAIYYEEDLPGKWQAYTGENARFFAEPPPASPSPFNGRSEPLGSPGGAAKLGVVGADTPLVTGLPPQG
jgi:NAD-dependent dihydropyrimidine dehydrogenase PreA subunit